MDTQNLLLSILVALIATVIPMILLFLRVYMKKAELSNKKQEIELEMFRKSYENSIYTLNEKLTLDEARWKDVNHILYEAAKRKIDSYESKQRNSFLDSLSIERSQFEEDEKSAFLLAPINPRFRDKIYTVKEACASIGIDCYTADEEFISGPILSEIVKKMLSATVVIAVIDGRNPNVYYELGLAHAFGKTVIMVSGGLEDIPFDIQSQRMVLVDWDKINESVEKIRKAVSESVLWANKSIKRTR